MGVIAYVAAIVAFVLAALGVTLGSIGTIDMIAVGLALFTLGHLVGAAALGRG